MHVEFCWLTAWNRFLCLQLLNIRIRDDIYSFQSYCMHIIFSQDSYNDCYDLCIHTSDFTKTSPSLGHFICASDVFISPMIVFMQLLQYLQPHVISCIASRSSFPHRWQPSISFSLALSFPALLYRVAEPMS